MEDMEQRKLELDQQKMKYTVRSFWVDAAGKLLLPLCVFVLAVATYVGNTDQSERRLRFETDAKAADLRQKEVEIGLRRSDMDLARDSYRSGFFQVNRELILSRDPDAEARVTELAHIAFSVEQERNEVIARIRKMRVGLLSAAAAPASVAQMTGSVSPQAAYIEAGRNAAKAADFSLALQYFDNATVFAPADAVAWNHKAYAQMRLGDAGSALASISRAISLNPQDSRLKTLMALNAAKILCSLGRIDSGVSYLNASAAAAPGLFDTAREDGELRRLCALA